MRKPASYLVSEDPDPTKSKGQKVITEQDFYWCCHCGAHRQCAPFVEPLNFCRNCMQPHCDRSRCFTCTPFEKKLDLIEKGRK